MCFSWENQQSKWEIFQQAMFGGSLKQLQACASWPIRRFVRNDDWVTHEKTCT
jgi:hypothetical protein